MHENQLFILSFPCIKTETDPYLCVVWVGVTWNKIKTPTDKNSPNDTAYYVFENSVFELVSVQIKNIRNTKEYQICAGPHEIMGIRWCSGALSQDNSTWKIILCVAALIFPSDNEQSAARSITRGIHIGSQRSGSGGVIRV